MTPPSEISVEQQIEWFSQMLNEFGETEETAPINRAIEKTLRTHAELEKDAARYKWLRNEAYVMNARHGDGACAYEVQNEAVALWIKTPTKHDDESVDSAIDMQMCQCKAHPIDGYWLKIDCRVHGNRFDTALSLAEGGTK